jgi:two-component system, chemotaxis family, chemotaxis protein CheY
MPLKALVVDDSRVMRNMVKTNLTKARLGEFEFVEAEDGADALTKFDDSIDIAFVDWNMPNMTGIEFVRQVRARGNTEHVPMVMVTSEKAMGKIEEALDEAGANAYICKPFTAEEMQHKLQSLVEGVEALKQAPPPSGGSFFGKLFG